MFVISNLNLIRGNIFNWFKSYLSNRKQCVNWICTDSKIVTVSCGISNGSILGPLLFILYVNDYQTSQLDYFLFYWYYLKENIFIPLSHH